MRGTLSVYIFFLICVFIYSCDNDNEGSESVFVIKDNAAIGIEFSNNLVSTDSFNVYKYRNFYNGGGVAIGDIDNDGLVDIYMVSNQENNKLYHNEGDFSFSDITQDAGVAGNRPWSTGVIMVDINNDGYLDIYVCNSGDPAGLDKENELFINNGNLTFTESAADYNLNDKGFSTHASFFDYDKDGDLDVYILNNSYEAIGSFNLRKNERPNRDVLGGDKLMQNQNGKFVDVSAEAGIYGSVIGFGLGVTVSDFNGDNWEDIFVSNDFFERDYLYINQKNGTFSEDLENQIHSISAASMGADAADIDNDGRTDIFVTDMLPVEYERLKTVTTFDDWNRYQYNLKNGYHHQFTRNMLHHNLGQDKFNEVSRYAGVEASDWSWGALFFDMDNDGLKDLYIANGIYKDLTDQDYLQYIANESIIESLITEEGVNYKELIDIIPSNPIKNQSYKNEGHLQFREYKNSGLNTKSFSNGAAYGDLDNDGDLDLVVNNINMPCFVYENKSNSLKNNYIKLNLIGKESNRYAVGAKITVTTDEQTLSYENIPTRGFESCMDPRPNIGVGNAKSCDIQVIWPSGNINRLEGVATNQILTITESTDRNTTPSKVSKPLFGKIAHIIDFKKEENKYVDFNKERLIYHMRSNEGPRHAEGDINGDGLSDLVIPGSKSYETAIYIQNISGKYEKLESQTSLLSVKESEHTKAILFDADGDKDLDIYLTSGGVELTPFSEYMYDHLLFNNGQGQFKLSPQRLPAKDNRISSNSVDYSDIDGDGDMDLFVGERIKIGKFGKRCSGYILVNDGNGQYKDMTDSLCPDLKNIGMITDGLFCDLDSDGDDDLVICGEYMPISIFINNDGKFSKQNIECDVPISGWWNRLHITDVDNDGDLDILAGNHGENSRFTASEDYPMKLYFSDFDNNGTQEGVTTFTRENGKDYPFALRHNLIDQMKGLKKRFPDFASFKDADITKIFTEEELSQADILVCDQLKTVLLLNNGNFNFSSSSLPSEAQLSPIYAIDTKDFESNGHTDIVMGGNLFGVVPEIGIYDGTYGLYLKNEGGLNYTTTGDGSGLRVDGEIRDFIINDSLLMVIVSNDTITTFKFK